MPLKENVDLVVKSENDTELDESWQHKATAEPRQLSNEQLKSICMSYGIPFTNKTNEKLVETVLLGPVINQSITEVENFLNFNPSHRTGMTKVTNSTLAEIDRQELDIFWPVA